MKTNIIYRFIGLIFLMVGWTSAQGQYQQEVPGDNFSLEGALELFKKSESPEQLERLLNDPKSRVNNLDLNGDGYIDYIRVVDLYEGNVHVFILQAMISANESQDIAVITLEKQANGKAVLQITGDEDIYGVETIIEPTREVYSYAGSRSSRFVVNVWSWPMVRYVYSPYYSVWVSPWHWSYRPHWWSPWRPIVYYDYYTYWRPFRHHYTICHTHRVVYAYNIYRPRRTTSVIVHNRHHNHIVKYRSTYIDKRGSYRYNDRPDRRRIDASVRYNANGRISSSSNRSVNSQSTNYRTSERSNNANSRRSSWTQDNSSNSDRSTSNGRVSSNNYRQTNSGSGKSSSLNDRTNSYNRNSNQQQQTPVRVKREETSLNKRPDRSYSNNSGNTQRSSNVPKVQQSRQISSGNSNIRSSSGRSSGNSSISRSSNRTSSRGNIQRSSGNSYTNKSNSNSNVNRSSSSSNSQRSSGRSSSNSGSRSSSNSNKQGRGRH